MNNVSKPFRYIDAVFAKFVNVIGYFFNSKASVNAATNICTSLLGRGVVFCLSIFLSRTMGAAEFGRYSLAYMAIGTFQVFAAAGITTALIKSLSERPNDREWVKCVTWTAHIQTIIVGVVVFVFVSMFSGLFAEKLMHDLKGAENLRIVAVTVFLSGVISAHKGVYIGLQRFKEDFISNTIAALISIPMVVYAGRLYGSEGALYAGALAAFIQLLIGFYLLRNVIGLPWMKGVRYVKSVTKTSFSVFGASSIALPVTWYCSTLLTGIKDGYREVAILNAVSLFIGIMQMLPSVGSQALMPMLASGHLEQKHYLRGVWKIFIAMLVITIGASYLGNQALWLFKLSHPHANVVLFIVLGTSCVLVANTMLTNLAYAKGYMKMIWVVNLVWGAIFLALAKISIEFGVIGIAGARFIAYITSVLLILGLLTAANGREKFIKTQRAV